MRRLIWMFLVAILGIAALPATSEAQSSCSKAMPADGRPSYSCHKVEGARRAWALNSRHAATMRQATVAVNACMTDVRLKKEFQVARSVIAVESVTPERVELAKWRASDGEMSAAEVMAFRPATIKVTPSPPFVAKSCQDCAAACEVAHDHCVTAVDSWRDYELSMLACERQVGKTSGAGTTNACPGLSAEAQERLILKGRVRHSGSLDECTSQFANCVATVTMSCLQSGGEK